MAAGPAPLAAGALSEGELSYPARHRQKAYENLWENCDEKRQKLAVESNGLSHIGVFTGGLDRLQQ